MKLCYICYNRRYKRRPPHGGRGLKSENLITSILEQYVVPRTGDVD